MSASPLLSAMRLNFWTAICGEHVAARQRQGFVGSKAIESTSNASAASVVSHNIKRERYCVITASSNLRGLAFHLESLTARMTHWVSQCSRSWWHLRPVINVSYVVSDIPVPLLRRNLSHSYVICSWATYMLHWGSFDSSDLEMMSLRRLNDCDIACPLFPSNYVVEFSAAHVRVPTAVIGINGLITRTAEHTTASARHPDRNGSCCRYQHERIETVVEGKRLRVPRGSVVTPHLFWSV